MKKKSQADLLEEWVKDQKDKGLPLIVSQKGKRKKTRITQK